MKYQCENCNCHFNHEPVMYPDPDSKWAKCQFCSDDCAQEAYEDVLVDARESYREYEMYGNDRDSWYR